MKQTFGELKESYLGTIHLLSHSRFTIKSYKTGLNNFEKFLDAKYESNVMSTVEKIKSGNLDVYTLLQNFVIHLDANGVGGGAIQSYLASTKGFLRHAGIKINSDDLKQSVKIPRIIKKRETPISKDDINRLLHVSSPRLQIAILVSVSGGMRLEEMVSLTISDIDFTTTPTTVVIRSEIAKRRVGRDTYLTSEATQALKDYLSLQFGWRESQDNSLLKNTHIFGRYSKEKTTVGKFSIDAAKHTLQKLLRESIRKIPELEKFNENGRLAIHFHGFRKYFRTNVGNVCGRDIAENLMGHGFYMDTYYQMPEDKKRQMYLDVEPYLTISDFKEVEKNLKTLSMKYTELEAKFKEFKEYAMTKSIQVPENMR